MYGSLKSREWWSSDLMPVIFLFSAIISGVRLLAVLYVISCQLRKVAVDMGCLKGMAYTLSGFMMFTLLLEGVEFASLVYRGREGTEMILEFVKGPLMVPFVILQFGIGSATPLVVLYVDDLARHRRQDVDHGRVRQRMPCVARGADDALECRHRRGRKSPKTGKGLLTYTPTFLGREGLFAAAGVIAAPFMLLSIMVRIFPPWSQAIQAP